LNGGDRDERPGMPVRWRRSPTARRCRTRTPAKVSMSPVPRARLQIGASADRRAPPLPGGRRGHAGCGARQRGPGTPLWICVADPANRRDQSSLA
jgi:hypothetical protein